MLPEKIGEYNILDSLGSGTFGDVYKVEKDEKLYALKHIVLGSKVDNVILQLEVDSHGSIPKHENIVGFVDYFKSWYRWNIVLEFCDLGTLESYLIRRSPEKVTILSFMLDMACGLNHLHSNNIVHRDIKPENILLVQGTNDTPVCKISDFGVARFISEAPKKLTNGEANEEKYFQTLRGTPYFVAPEVRRGQYTKSCDIFSLGIVYYLMFAREIGSDKRLVPYVRGGTPFYKASEFQIKDQVKLHVKDESLNDLLCRMMMIDIHNRITAADLEDKLRDKSTTHRRETRQNNVLNILSTVKEQLEKLEKEGYSALLMWHDLFRDDTLDSTPTYKSVGPSIPPGEINNFLDNFTRLVETKTDDEQLDSRSETSDYPGSDELSTSSPMSTQSSPFEVEETYIAENDETPSTSTAACQTDPELSGLSLGPSGSLTSAITLSGLSGITLTCPASITLTSPAGITLSSAAGISVLGTLPEGHVAEFEHQTSEENSETSQPILRSRGSSMSSVQTVDTTSSKSSQSRSSSVRNVGRSSSFAARRKTSGTGRGTNLERSSSSASSKNQISTVTRARSSPAVTDPMSRTRTITSPKVGRKSSPSPSTKPSSPKSKTPTSTTARKTSTTTSDTTHAAAHNHPQPVSVKSPTLRKKKQPSPAPHRKISTTNKSSYTMSNGNSQSKTSAQTVNTSNSTKPTSNSTTANSHSTKATNHSTANYNSSKSTSHSTTATSHSAKTTSNSSSTSATSTSHPSTKTPTSPKAKKKAPPSPQPTPKTDDSQTPNTTPSKKEDESKISVFGRFFRWK